MRVAALYDIHGNLPALEAVLEAIARAKVDRVVVGGDLFPGPMPLETLARLQALDMPVHFIRGNGDREVLACMAGRETEWYRAAPDKWREPVRWTAQQLQGEHEQLLASWPATLRLEIGDLGPVLFCHATPRDDNEIFTRATPEQCLRPIFEGHDAALVVCGHTHMQFDRTIGTTRVVNAGSIGMPFGAAGADWLLLGPGVELQHTAYDLAEAARRIRQTAYPQAAEFADRNVLHPPSAEETLAAYARVELK